MMGTPQNRWRETHQSGALLNHFVHAIFAPGGNPFDAVDFFEGFLAERFFLFPWAAWSIFDEPLLGSAEDYRMWQRQQCG